MLNKNKSLRTIPQLQFVEIRKMVSFDLSWNILTWVSQNMDEKKARLVAKKIIQTYTQLTKRQSSSLSITVRRFFSFWTILCWKLKINAGSYSSPLFLRVFIKKISEQQVNKLRRR